MRKYRKRALNILHKNITTEEAPSLLLAWVETGNQDCLLSYEEEGQLLVEIAEALEEAAREGAGSGTFCVPAASAVTGDEMTMGCLLARVREARYSREVDALLAALRGG